MDLLSLYFCKFHEKRLLNLLSVIVTLPDFANSVSHDDSESL